MNVIINTSLPYMFSLFDYMSLNTILISIGVIMLIGALGSMTSPSAYGTDDAELGLLLLLLGIAFIATGLGYLTPVKNFIVDMFLG